MATITIDDIEYDFDKLSDDAKSQILSLQFVDGELQRLNAQAAVLQTARNAYVNSLKIIMDKEKSLSGDTIKFS